MLLLARKVNSIEGSFSFKDTGCTRSDQKDGECQCLKFKIFPGYYIMDFMKLPGTLMSLPGKIGLFKMSNPYVLTRQGNLSKLINNCTSRAGNPSLAHRHQQHGVGHSPE